MHTAPGWHITIACDCGQTATYHAVVPSLAGDQAARDGWLVDAGSLARPGAHEALCPLCNAASTLRSVG